MYDGVEVLYSACDERAECRRHSSEASLSVARVVGTADSAHVSRVGVIRCHQTHLTTTNIDTQFYSRRLELVVAGCPTMCNDEHTTAVQKVRRLIQLITRCL